MFLFCSLIILHTWADLWPNCNSFLYSHSHIYKYPNSHDHTNGNPNFDANHDRRLCRGVCFAAEK